VGAGGVGVGAGGVGEDGRRAAGAALGRRGGGRRRRRWQFKIWQPLGAIFGNARDLAF